MTKKLLSSMLAIAMLSATGSVCTITASAEENAITGGEITFRITDGWKFEGAKYYIHIWDGRGNGTELYEWQSANEVMTISADGETATYNVPAGNWNLLILSDNKGAMTYDSVFNQNCIGDTFHTIIDETLAPTDAPKKGTEIVWDNNPDCGRHRTISGFKVKGHAYIPGETDQTIFDDFCELYGPKSDGTCAWDEEYKDSFNMTWEEVKAQVASQLNLSEAPTDDNSEVPRTQFAEKYGVKRGLPVTPDMEIPERYSTDFDDSEYVPDDWDGYYNVYYFEAPDNWVNEHKDKKEAGFDIGFYWYCGSINAADWPGVPAQKLSVIDQNGNDIYADRNIYYAFAPSFATSIIWDNGIGDKVADNKKYKLFTNDIKIDDPMQNDISDRIYSEGYDTIEGAEIAGCLFYDPEEVYLNAPLSDLILPVYIPKVAYFDPNTGETTDEPLKDANGNYVTVPNHVFDYTKVVVNPYYDMDYTYVPEVEAPTQAPTEAPTVAPTQAPTQKPTQAPTANPTQKPTQATSNGTVATADSNAVKVLSAILLLSVAGVTVSQKRKFYR